MKSLRNLIFVALAALTAPMSFGAANDIKISQSNSGGTAWIDRIFQPSGGTTINSVATFRTGLGLGTGNSPTFTALTLSGATPLTLAGGGTITAASGSMSYTPSGTGFFTLNDSAGLPMIEIRPGLQADRNTMIGNSNGVAITTGNQNTAVGWHAFVAGTTGSVNVAVGNQTLLANTTGSNNTALGVEAMVANTTGSDNTAIGYHALGANIAGAGSTAVGKFALFTSTASLNAAVGWQAMYLAADASRSVAVGPEALYTVVSTADNVAVGYRALYAATGANHVAVGSEAGLATTTGGNLTAIGMNALKANTTGSNNAAVGFISMLFNTTGSDNAAIGRESLRGNTTGSLNSAIGLEAGAYIANGSTANQTSGTSVYLGANTKSSASGNANEVVIGYNAIGGGSNSVTLGNTSITKTFLQGASIVSTDTLSGAGAISITKDTTKYTSTGGAQALTLADGVDGQIKRIIHDVDGGSGVLTPTTKTGFSTITFTNAGDSATLEFVTTRGWICLASYGSTVAP